MKLQYTQIIDRPLDKVFHFMAIDHVRNHPRWDSDIELELPSDEPIGVGTIFRRRNSRGGKVVEGTMEVTEFLPNQAMSTIIREGGREMYGQIAFEAIDGDHTRVTISLDMPWMDDSTDTSFLVSRLNHAGEVRKALIESEL